MGVDKWELWAPAFRLGGRASPSTRCSVPLNAMPQERSITSATARAAWIRPTPACDVGQTLQALLNEQRATNALLLRLLHKANAGCG